MRHWLSEDKGIIYTCAKTEKSRQAPVTLGGEQLTRLIMFFHSETASFKKTNKQTNKMTAEQWVHLREFKHKAREISAKDALIPMGMFSFKQYWFNFKQKMRHNSLIGLIKVLVSFYCCPPFFFQLLSWVNLAHFFPLSFTLPCLSSLSLSRRLSQIAFNPAAFSNLGLVTLSQKPQITPL